MPDKSELVREWFQKGENDFVTARLALAAGGPTDTIAVLLQQAAEKHLKGYLISKGWRLQRTHDLVALIEKAAEYNPTFRDYVKLADRLFALYIEERYPSRPTSDVSKEEIASLMEQTVKIISLIKEQAKL